MTANVKVRPASGRDLERLVPLVVGYFEFYKVTQSVAQIRHFLRQRLRRRDARIFLAVRGRETLGFAVLYPTFASLALSRAWILYDLYVVPTARRQGVAAALLARARKLGLQSGAAELVLETAVSNRPAQRLYARQGWIHDRQFRLYRLDLRRRK